MKIAVLAGGTSTERNVSLVTSENVCKALRKLGHKANVIDVFYGTEDYKDTTAFFEDNNDLEKLAEGLKALSGGVKEEVSRRKEAGESFFGNMVVDICRAADVVFMGLHGENGENGKVQAAFDLLGVKYTGPGYLSSALSMDKAITKTMLTPVGIPMPEGEILLRHEPEENAKKNLPVPCVVKPACGGSSVGVTIAFTQEERDEAVKKAFELEEKILVEKYIKGREFSVGVCDGKALPVVEIIPEGGVYDFEHKYDPEGAKEICPAEVPEDVAAKMKHWAEKACEAVGITTYSRVDQLIDEKGDIYCLEINTLPGMTPTSLLPKEAAADGLSYEELVQKLIDISLKNFNTESF